MAAEPSPRACRRCIAVWAPDCNRQLVRFYAWRRGARNQQRREELVAQGESMCSQIRFRLVLLGLRTATLRQRRLRGISAELRERQARRCAAAVLSGWSRTVVSQRERLVVFNSHRRVRILSLIHI